MRAATELKYICVKMYLNSDYFTIGDLPTTLVPSWEIDFYFLFLVRYR